MDPEMKIRLRNGTNIKRMSTHEDVGQKSILLSMMALLKQMSSMEALRVKKSH